MNTEKVDLVSDILEPLVDRHGLLHILVSLEIMCQEKSAHIESAWQDRALVKQWNTASSICGKAAREVEKLTI